MIEGQKYSERVASIRLHFQPLYFRRGVERFAGLTASMNFEQWLIL